MKYPKTSTPTSGPKIIPILDFKSRNVDIDHSIERSESPSIQRVNGNKTRIDPTLIANLPIIFKNPENCCNYDSLFLARAPKPE